MINEPWRIYCQCCNRIIAFAFEPYPTNANLFCIDCTQAMIILVEETAWANSPKKQWQIELNRLYQRSRLYLRDYGDEWLQKLEDIINPIDNN